MAATVTRQPLTKDNLTLHDQLLQNHHATEEISSWVERVIIEEQTHLLYAHQRTSISNMHVHGGDNTIERDTDPLDQRLQIPSTAAATDLDNTKLFKQQRPFMFLESPLERFLTPGSSDPTYFSRPALAHMGVQYGSMEGLKERSDITRGHVKKVRDRALLERDISRR
ncbi:hypothetical protein BDW59DRAFT_3045 [Aspergillus cavernicola]|uniref:Uncharacterized protein n=1 Tax=Aspergillus cavernicola TaxID=176166 RepID=A0ABR4J540_9EURO